MGDLTLAPHRRSNIVNFDECVYSYYLAVVEGARGGNVHTERGIRLHYLFETLFHKDEVAYTQTYGKPLQEEIRAFKKVESLGSGMETEKRYYVNRDGEAVEPDEPNGMPKDAWLYCTIDVHNLHNLAIDWKMGQAGFHQDLWDDGFRFQAEFYLACMRPHLPKKGLYEFSFVFPFIDGDSDEVPAKTFSFDLSAIDDIWEGIKEKVLRVENQMEGFNGNYPINKKNCSRCLVWASCKHMNQSVATELGVMRWEGGLTTETAPRAVEFLEALQTLTKQVEKEMKAYCDKNGNIETPEGLFGFYPKSKKSIKDVRGTIAKIVEEGEGDGAREEIYKNLSFAVTKALKVAKKYKVDVTEFIDEKTENWFGRVK